MNNLNNLFGSLSDKGIQFPLDFNSIADDLRKVKGTKENVYYDYDYSDNSSDVDLNSNSVSYTVTDIETRTTAIGRNNSRKVFTGRGNDVIIGLGTATVSADLQAIAFGQSNFMDTSAADGNARASFVATVEATGISNVGTILTAKGNDTIIGLGDIQSVASAVAQSSAADLTMATANSDATAIVDAIAIGIENAGTISAGGGKDVVAGIANTATETTAEAVAIANAFGANLGHKVAKQLDNAAADSTSAAVANSLVSTLGFANSGRVNLGWGNDVLFGLANSDSSSNAAGDAQTASRANKIATATADAEAIAITVDDTVGIVNQGLITTGAGHDSIIGLAFNNQPQAIAEANAEANGETTDTSADANTLSQSSTSGAIAIGIDNSGGTIRTGNGHDRLIAYGSDIGITGGSINMGQNNDRVLAYGGRIGVNDALIATGRGHDYFQAAIGDVDSVTGAVNLAEDQSNSIRNSRIYGGTGNDTFDIGGFSGAVTIDGGRNYDVLRLSGDVDSYSYRVTGSNNHLLTIENAGSVLTVANVEAIYLGDSEQFSISDFA